MYWNIIMNICFFISTTAFSLPPITPKFCKNCKYFISDKSISKSLEFGKCQLFNTTTVYKDDSYLVTGIDKSIVNVKYDFCSIARNYDNMCGQDGKYFEDKA